GFAERSSPGPLPDQVQARIELRQQCLAVGGIAANIDRAIGSDRDAVTEFAIDGPRRAIRLLQEQRAVGGVFQEEYVLVAAGAEAVGLADDVDASVRCDRDTRAAIESSTPEGLLEGQRLSVQPRSRGHESDDDQPDPLHGASLR